jgi:hypothetical protein
VLPARAEWDSEKMFAFSALVKNDLDSIIKKSRATEQQFIFGFEHVPMYLLTIRWKRHLLRWQAFAGKDARVT